jgi:hypothetical protein
MCSKSCQKNKFDENNHALFRVLLTLNGAFCFKSVILLSRRIGGNSPGDGGVFVASSIRWACRKVTMNTITFTFALVLTLLLPIMFFASSLKMFFTTEELTEMGIRLEPWDLDEEGIAS